MLHGRFFNKNDKTNIRKILDRTSTLNLQECRSYIQASYDSMHRLHESDERIADDYKPLFDILKKNNYQGWLVVEAEQDPKKANPLEYAIKGYKYITDTLKKSNLEINNL